MLVILGDFGKVNHMKHGTGKVIFGMMTTPRWPSLGAAIEDKAQNTSKENS